MNELRKPGKKGLLAFLLAVCMCIAMLPASGLKAAEAAGDTGAYALEEEDRPSFCMVKFHYPRDFYYDEEDESGIIRKRVKNDSIMAAPSDYLESEDRQRHIIGWTLDSSDNTLFDFENTPITADTASEAKRGWDFYPILDKCRIKFYDQVFEQEHEPVYVVSGEVASEVSEILLTSPIEGVEFDGWQYFEQIWDEDEDDYVPSVVMFDASRPITSDLSLYARWSGDYATVIFHYPDDFYSEKIWDPEYEEYNTTSEKKAHVKNGGMVSAPTEHISNEYRKIIGWTEDPNGTGEPFAFDKQAVTSENAVYLYPIVDKYRIKFYGGGYYDESVYVEKGGKVAEPQLDETEAWEGSFGGWYYWETEEDDEKTLFDFSKPINRDYELSIKWNEKYNVTFHYPNDFRDYGDDDWYDKTELRVGEGQQIPKPQISENNGKRKITGWTTAKGGTEKFDFDKLLSKTDLDEDEELHLYPILDRYMVEFNSDATDYYETVYVQPGGKVTKPADLSREHYTFAGWRYEDEQTWEWKTFDFQTPVNQDYILNAEWQKAYSFIIKLWNYDSEDFEYNWDGYGKAEYCYVTNGTSYSDAIFSEKDYPTPTRPGYEFTGWYYDKECKTECAKGSSFNPQYGQYEIDWDEDINLILYAGWKKNGTDTAIGYCDVTRYSFMKGQARYERSYCVEKGTVIPGLEVKTGTIEGAGGISYDFNGEYYKDEKKEQLFDIAEPITKDTSIYWAGTYDFTIHCKLISYDGVTECAEKVSSDYYHPMLTSLPTPTRAGYTFTGWYLDGECKYIYPVGTEISARYGYVALFAGWQRQDTGKIDYSMPNVNYHKLTFDLNANTGRLFLGNVFVERGQSAAYYKDKLGDPVFQGHYFAGWYLDEAGTIPFDFDMVPTSDMTIYAKWGINAEGSVITPENGTEVPPADQDKDKDYPKEVSKITLSQAYVIIPKKEHVQLKASVIPADARNTTVSWRSSDEKVATVTAGKVTAKKAGTATIYARTANGKEAACAILVSDVTLNARSAVLQVGTSSDAVEIATKYPSSDKVKSYRSSDKSIVKINKKGKMTAGKKTGTATITVTMKSGASATCKVTVQKKKVTAKSLKLSAKSLKLKKKKSVTLKAIKNPISAPEKITWSCSNKRVAKVNQKGKVTALKKGSAKITAKTSNGKKATCKIIVK